MKLSKILKKIKVKEIIGDLEKEANEIVQLDEKNMRSDTLSWCNDKSINKLNYIKNGIIICTELAKIQNLNKECTYIITDNPRLEFRNVLLLFVDNKKSKSGILKNSLIDKSSKIGERVELGSNVVIEANCLIGDGTKIGHNTVIHSNTIIGKNVIIGCNNTIGGIGFGYELDENKEYIFIPHIGNVIIEDSVEIGNNTCVDRAVIGSTILRRNVKIDNLVHIAHGVIIDENSLIIANAMIAGSVNIGKNCWVAPSASILNKLTVGNNAVIGMGAVVLKVVEENAVIIGNPGKKLEK